MMVPWIEASGSHPWTFSGVLQPLLLLDLPQLFLYFLYIFLVLSPPATASQELLLQLYYKLLILRAQLQRGGQDTLQGD